MSQAVMTEEMIDAMIEHFKDVIETMASMSHTTTGDILQRLASKFDMSELSELAATSISDDPKSECVLTSGKHKGETFREASEDRSYVSWIIQHREQLTNPSTIEFYTWASTHFKVGYKGGRTTKKLVGDHRTVNEPSKDHIETTSSSANNTSAHSSRDDTKENIKEMLEILRSFRQAAAHVGGEQQV
jgi:hypothetical protein